MSWFRFVFLLNLLEFCHLVCSFLIQNEMKATHFKPKEHAYICDIAFSSYIFISFLSLALHTRRQFTYQQDLKYFLSPSTYSIIYSEKYALYLGKF